jgi:hypothetical protein
MKRLLFTMTLALGLFAMSSFANAEDVAPAALESFKTSFKTATDVNWSVSENYYRANFSLNGQLVSAFYNHDGKMIALTRNITSLQLPIALQASLKNNYDCYWITDLVEMANEDGTTYYVTLENADTKLVLKSSANSDWSHYKKQRKS